MSFTYRGTKHFLSYVSNLAGSLLKVRNAYPSQASGFTSVFGGVCVAHRFSFLSCFFLFFFVVCYVSLMLPVSLNCQFLIAPSGFTNVYWQKKKQSAGRHVAPRGHIMLIPSKPNICLTPQCCVLTGEATNTNFIGFDMIRPRFETLIYMWSR